MKNLLIIIALFLFSACGTTLHLEKYTTQDVTLNGKEYTVTTYCDYKTYHYCSTVNTTDGKHLKQIRKEEYTKAKDAVEILMKSDVYKQE